MGRGSPVRYLVEGVWEIGRKIIKQFKWDTVGLRTYFRKFGNLGKKRSNFNQVF